MSTYTREGRFTPVNINSDPTQQLNYIQQRMGLQAKGESIIRSQYQNLLDLELTHGDNQNKLNDFFKSVNEKINSSVSKDVSDYNNVQKTLNIFDPLTNSPEYRSIILDNQYTKHYKQELGKAQYYRNKADKDGAIGSGYSDYNYKELVDNYNRFKSAPGNDTESWGDTYTYKPYYDYTEEKRQKINEFMKLPDKHSQDSIDNNGITTTITYEGKSADQIQKYLDANLSAKAKDQMLLEGRVESDSLDDDEYIKLLQGSHLKSISDINNRIAQLKIFGQQNKGSDINKEITNLEIQRKEYETSFLKLNSVDYKKNILKNKKGAFANYYLNSKIASFAEANANNRVSSELGTNSAFVNALNRQADLWKFTQKFAQDQQQFEADQRYKYAALDTDKYVTALREGLIDLDGKPISANNNGLGTNKVLTDAPITNENQQSVREQQEKELQGGVDQVLQQTLPYIKGAFGEVSGSTPIEISQRYLSNIVDLSNKLQIGDKETLDLLYSGEKNLTPQQKNKQKILHILQDNEDKVLAYKAYNEQKKQIINNAKQTVLKELRSNGLTVEKANALLNNEEYNKYKYIFTSYNNIDKPGTYKTLDALADSLVNNPELAEQFKKATKTGALSKIGTILGTTLVEIPGAIYNHYLNNDDESFYKNQDKRIHQLDAPFDNIKNIGTQAQLQINQNLNNSYFSTQKELSYHKPLDTESPQAKKDLSLFNNEVTTLLPYIKDADEDFNATMVTNIVKNNKGATVYYQPSEMIEGKLVSTGDKEKSIRIESPLVSIGIEDHRDRLLLGTMTLSPTGETPIMIAKGQIPFQYQIGTSSGTKYSKNEMGDGKFVAKVIINDKVITVPQEFYRPSEIESFMRETSNNTAQAVLKELKYDLEKQNKAPLSTEQKEELMRSGLFKEMFNIKLKEAFDKGKVFSTFGVSNPDYSDLENLFLKD